MWQRIDSWEYYVALSQNGKSAKSNSTHGIKKDGRQLKLDDRNYIGEQLEESLFGLYFMRFPRPNWLNIIGSMKTCCRLTEDDEEEREEEEVEIHLQGTTT